MLHMKSDVYSDINLIGLHHAKHSKWKRSIESG